MQWSSVNIEPKDSSRERRIVDGIHACVGNESRQVLHFLPLPFHTYTNPTVLKFFFFSLLPLLPLPPLFLSFCLLSFLIVFKWIASFFNPDIRLAVLTTRNDVTGENWSILKQIMLICSLP